MTFGCRLLLIATIVFIWGEGGWKSSSQFAVLFHGLPGSNSTASRNVKDYADMTNLVHEMHVELLKTDSDKRLVSQNTLAQMQLWDGLVEDAAQK